MRHKMMLIGVIGIVIGVLLSTAAVFAGNLNPGVGSTGAGSQMYTLQQIYTGPAQPDAGSISTGAAPSSQRRPSPVRAFAIRSFAR